MEKSKPSPWEDEYQGSEQAPIYEPLWKILEQFLEKHPCKSILDYGCGDGNYSVLMQKPGCHVLGIDVSAKAIEIARNSCSSENVSFLTENTIPESLPDNSFDGVVLLNLLHCLSNNERPLLLQKIKRVLKNNGYLFASLLSKNDESYPRHEWEEVETGTFDDGAGKLFHFFDLEEIAREFNGIKIIQTEVLENIHPDLGRKSSLHVVAGQIEK